MSVVERPIIFSGPMIRAILSGNKTQTRRIAKPVRHPDFGCWTAPSEMAGEAQHVIGRACPYGEPGDRLYVKETTYKVEDAGWQGPVYVESDDGRHAAEWGYGDYDDPDRIEPYALKKRPAIFMPRRMSRITLDITSVRVERLHDISEADAAAEGVDRTDEFGEPMYRAFAGSPWTSRASGAFEDLWEHINGMDSWDSNPWVWIIAFQRQS